MTRDMLLQIGEKWGSHQEGKWVSFDHVHVQWMYNLYAINLLIIMIIVFMLCSLLTLRKYQVIC